MKEEVVIGNLTYKNCYAIEAALYILCSFRYLPGKCYSWKTRKIQHSGLPHAPYNAVRVTVKNYETPL